jgi:hypothetical protein
VIGGVYPGFLIFLNVYENSMKYVSYFLRHFRNKPTEGMQKPALIDLAQPKLGRESRQKELFYNITTFDSCI